MNRCTLSENSKKDENRKNLHQNYQFAYEYLWWNHRYVKRQMWETYNKIIEYDRNTFFQFDELKL